MAVSIKDIAEEKYGGNWNEIIFAICAFELKFALETTKDQIYDISQSSC